MANKLQELTDKLYSEGLSKGREEGGKILADAKKEAAKIIEEARQEAESIRQKAEKDAEALKAKATSDLRMASEQCIQATKADIEKIVVAQVCSETGLKEPEFLKQIVTAVAQRFCAQESADLSLVLPESLKAELEGWVAQSLQATLGRGVTASFSKKIAGGFTIGPADGSYFVNLSDESFRALIAEYIRPLTRKILFG